MLEDLPECARVALSHVLPAETILDARAARASDLFPQRGVAEQAPDRRSESLRIVGIDEQTGLPVFDDLQDSVHSRSHDRFAAGQRLNHGDAERLEARGQDEDSAVMKEPGNRRTRLLADELNLFFQ